MTAARPETAPGRASQGPKGASGPAAVGEGRPPAGVSLCGCGRLSSHKGLCRWRRAPKAAVAPEAGASRRPGAGASTEARRLLQAVDALHDACLEFAAARRDVVARYPGLPARGLAVTGAAAALEGDG